LVGVRKERNWNVETFFIGIYQQAPMEFIDFGLQYANEWRGTRREQEMGEKMKRKLMTMVVMSAAAAGWRTNIGT
jgi:hypothetical protein